MMELTNRENLRKGMYLQYIPVAAIGLRRHDGEHPLHERPRVRGVPASTPRRRYERDA